MNQLEYILFFALLLLIGGCLESIIDDTTVTSTSFNKFQLTSSTTSTTLSSLSFRSYDEWISISKGISDCLFQDYVKESVCITNMALDYNQPELCQIVDILGGGDECLSQYAVDSSDPLVCLMLSKSKWDCLAQVAIKKKDSKICDLVPGESDRCRSAYAYRTETIQPCYEITGDGLDSINNCIHVLAIEKNPGYCSNLPPIYELAEGYTSTRDLCILVGAINTGEDSFCNNISDNITRDGCFCGAKREIGLCEQISNKSFSEYVISAVQSRQEFEEKQMRNCTNILFEPPTYSPLPCTILDGLMFCEKKKAEYGGDWYLYCKAYSTQEPGLCAQIAVSSSLSSQCYITLSKLTENPMLCDLIPNKNTVYDRNFCLQQYIEFTKDTSVCGKLGDPIKKINTPPCRNQVVAKYSTFDQLSECRRELTVGSAQEGLPDFYCDLRIALTTNNKVLCDKIPLTEYRHICEIVTTASVEASNHKNGGGG